MKQLVENKASLLNIKGYIGVEFQIKNKPASRITKNSLHFYRGK